MPTMQTLRDDARAELRERWNDDAEKDLATFGDPSDTIHEIADSHVPVYNAARLEAIASDVTVASRDLELAEGATGILELCGIAIYEDLWLAAPAQE